MFPYTIESFYSKTSVLLDQSLPFAGRLTAEEDRSIDPLFFYHKIKIKSD